MYPNLKAWLTSILYGEPGDICSIRLMNGEEYYTDSLTWIRNSDYTYSLKVFPNSKLIHFDQIRFIHVEITEDTNTTIEMLADIGQEADAKSCVLMLEIAQTHTINYLKRRQEKELKQQNEGDIYNFNK